MTTVNLAHNQIGGVGARDFIQELQDTQVTIIDLELISQSHK